jgi:hypothetical protein
MTAKTPGAIIGRATKVALAKAVAVDKLLNGRLVGAVVASGPGGMGLVQGPVFENLLVDGAGGDEHESPHIGVPGCLDQLQGAEDVLLHELQHVTLTTPETVAGIVQGGMDHRIAAFDETGTSGLVSQFTRHPLHLLPDGVKSASVAPRAIPAAAEVPLGGEAGDDVAAQEAGSAGDGNSHGNGILLMVGRPPNPS